MSKVICIAGESGSGKTTSMRNLDPKTTFYIDADCKGLSWKGWRSQYNTDNKNYKATDDGQGINNIEDVYFWKNPRKHEVRFRTVNGKKERYVVSTKAVDGNQLYKSLCTIRDRYNVRFEFCEKKDTGKKIIELLGRKDE